MTQSSRAVPETGVVDSGVASASVRPEPTKVDTVALIEELRTIAEYVCWDKFEDRFTSDPKKHPAWRAADALSAKDRELAETREGFLDCDTSEVDAGVLLDRLTVICDDGTSVLIAVTHSSDRYLAVIGRLGGP